MIGIIGGSGLYDVPGLREIERELVETPFGVPSGEIVRGILDDRVVAFLARHGSGHRESPTTINYRANIYALKAIGVTDLISLSAVGSLRDDLPPGTFVVVDQFVDRTFAREKSFFGSGFVAHVSMAEPVCGRLGRALVATCQQLGIAHADGGTYLAMEGPQFSTRAESMLYRSWGLSVIGMTNMPEAKLAREAEICYATVAMVTDYDSWRTGYASVTVDEVMRVLRENGARAQSLVRAVLPLLDSRPSPCPSGCDRALDHAVITSPAHRDGAAVARLQTITDRVP